MSEAEISLWKKISSLRLYFSFRNYFPYVPPFGLFFCVLSFLDGCFLFVCLLFCSVFPYLCVHFANLVFLNFFFFHLCLNLFLYLGVFFYLSFLSSSWLFVSVVFFFVSCFSLPRTPILIKKKKFCKSLFAVFLSPLFKNKCPEMIGFSTSHSFSIIHFSFFHPLFFLFEMFSPKKRKIRKTNLFTKPFL